MAKRADLRSKLKAADRRRQRRPQSGGSAPVSVAEPSVDVTGLIVESILEFRDGSQRFDDAIIIAALTACGRGIRPNGEQAAQLYDRLQQVALRERVPPRSLVAACHQLLAHADRGEPKSNERNPFAQYLAILVS